jgi:hypothetical protein
MCFTRKEKGRNTFFFYITRFSLSHSFLSYRDIDRLACWSVSGAWVDEVARGMVGRMADIRLSLVSHYRTHFSVIGIYWQIRGLVCFP